jgi:hypothetical protein
MGFSTGQEVLHMRRVCLKLKTVPCDMSLWSNGGNTGVNSQPDNQSSITLEVLKAPPASKASLMLQYTINEST